MKNLFIKEEELEQNNKSDFENFAFKNKSDQLDQKELNLLRGGGDDDEDIIDDWK
jgi:hypothetical protein